MASAEREKNSKIVSGYVHRMESNDNDFVVPDSVIQIIFLFFFQHLWDTQESGSNALIDGAFVSNKRRCEWYTAFGTFGVNKGIHKWILQIINIPSEPKPVDHLFIGIVTLNKT